MPTKAQMLTQKDKLWGKYNAAIEKILDGAQEYEIGTRKFTMADMGELQDALSKIEKEILRYGGGIRVKTAVYRSR
jgi:hypothetical protein